VLCRRRSYDFEGADIGLFELLQKTQVGAVKEADVINAVAHHDEAIKPDIDVKAAPDVGVKTSGTQHVRMWRTARHDFDPSRAVAGGAAFSVTNLTAHVDFKSRFDEREKACTPCERDIAPEYAFQNGLDEQKPRRKREIAINNQRFVLIKCPLMLRVGVFISKNRTGVHKARRAPCCCR